MERRITVAFLMLLGLIMLFPRNFTIAQISSPSCISQFALADQACGVLPSATSPKGRNHTHSRADDSDSGSGSSDDDDDDEDDDDDDDDNEEDDDVGDDSGDDEDEGDDRQRRKGHKRGSKHGKKRGRKHAKQGKKHGGAQEEEPRANRDCCRWLEELDESCVCNALLSLPPFLVKPKHEYRIKVGKSCKFRYNC